MYIMLGAFRVPIVYLKKTSNSINEDPADNDRHYTSRTCLTKAYWSIRDTGRVLVCFGCVL